jgi:hypothetical protein
MAYEDDDSQAKPSRVFDLVVAAARLVRAVEAGNSAEIANATAELKAILARPAYQMVNDNFTKPVEPTLEPSTPGEPVMAVQDFTPPAALTIHREKLEKNRLYKGEIVSAIILITLLVNVGRRVDKDDLIASFANQGVPIEPATLLSRISKMRSEGLVAEREREQGESERRKFVESAGVYRLTDKGVAAARTEAIKRRVSPDSLPE